MTETETSTAQFREFEENLSPVVRIVIFLCGLIPFLAPYELLLRPQWHNFSNLPFAFACLVSIGACTVSLAFFAFALFGLDRQIRFDSRSRTLEYRWSSPVIKLREESWPFSEISLPEVVREIDSEGPDYFSLSIKARDGRDISFGRFSDQAAAERERDAIRQLIG